MDVKRNQNQLLETSNVKQNASSP